MMLGVAVEQNIKIHHFDVSTAFPNGDKDTSIHMEMPKQLENYLYRIIIEESEKEDEKALKILEDSKRNEVERVCHLRKAVHGLKQAGRQWFVKLDVKLKSL
ncbi:hypothetical protein JTB14_033305 [Gonioctena quinquepunctata]|nr:hypothetical protein JTB14_033305 [Gonioctena quinquepunctata]